MAAAVAAIRARGGNVVFVAHPQGGFLARGDARAFPRARYWDALLAGTHTGGVNADDHPELRGFRLPELAHMDPRDTPTYTARLVPLILDAASSQSPRATPER